MNSLTLNQFGLTEIESQDLTKISGGNFWWGVVAGVVANVIYDAIKTGIEIHNSMSAEEKSNMWQG